MTDFAALSSRTTVIDEVTETLVAEWMDRHYKADRLNREDGRRGRLIADRISDMQRVGYTLISRHESVTGEAVWLTTDIEKIPRPRAGRR